MKSVDLEGRLVDFAARVVNAAEALPDSKAGNHIARQLVRSATSPAPDYGEARGAEPRRDFIHKMKIAVKELRETLVRSPNKTAQVGWLSEPSGVFFIRASWSLPSDRP
jgi:hypothetical protein